MLNRNQSTALALVAAGALLSGGCGDDDTTPIGTPDAGGGDTTVSDATGGDTDTGGTDTTVVPPEEDLIIAYTRDSTFDDTLPIELVIVESDCRSGNSNLCEPGLCDPVVVQPRTESEPFCNAACRVAGSVDYVVFADPGEPSTLRSLPLGDDYQPTADSTLIATDVTEFQVAMDTVAYRVGDDIHVYDLVSGSDSVAVTLQRAGGFTISEDATKLFIGEVASLTEMDLSVVDLGNNAVLPVFHFISGEEQGTGSFYSGREPMALSPDGSRLAVVTDARTSGPLCSSDADCTNFGGGCLQTATPPRCVRQELTVNVINLDESDLLRSRCMSDADCGADHFCDLSALDADATGECLPGRFTLGPAGPAACAQLSLGQYSDSRGDLHWRGDRAIVGVFGQDCIAGNIDVTDVVALSLDGAAFEAVVQNPGLDHGGCYDDVEACFDVAACNVQIDTSATSPSGQTVAFVADSPSASNNSELWIVQAFSGAEKELITSSIEWAVRSVSVHNAP